MTKKHIFGLLLGAGFLGSVLFSAACGDDDAVDCDTLKSTYNSNMKGIIDAKCVTCHKAGGTAATIGIYTTYNDMKPFFNAAWDEVNADRMPKDGPLTDEQKNAWECWKNAGFPEN
jgi:hypothetical protein